MRRAHHLRGLLLCSMVLVFATASFGQIGDIFNRLGLGNRKTLNDAKIASGLREALQVGTDNAVRLTGRPNGYFGNNAIKILMPENLRTLETGLRTVGYGSKVDEFELSMNRAAEAAAPAARSIFVDAILAMSFADARKILGGGDTAATDYFKETTSERLAVAFRPIVEKTMDENSVTQQYKALVGQTQRIPFLKRPDFDITQYVVSKSIDGLFYMLGQEETKIRKDPAARTTDLLKEVFGK